MAQTNLPIHNPQTGFADITALPDFSYFFLTPLQIALICLFIVCCAAIARFLYKKLRRQKPPVIIDPTQDALEKITRLRAELKNTPNPVPQIQLRLFASELAEIIRVFLTKKIDFQIIGLTAREISMMSDSGLKTPDSDLKTHSPHSNFNFKTPFPHSPQDILDTLISSIKTLFKETENLTFADKINAEANLSELIDIASSIVSTVDFESQRIAETLPTKS